MIFHIVDLYSGKRLFFLCHILVTDMFGRCTDC